MLKRRWNLCFVQAKKNIEARKAHIIRSVNQDVARLDILNALDDTSVLVVLDWAMKFIPGKYRESQADWFGKRGISWHVTVVMRRHAGKTLQTLNLVHVFQRSSQDSSYVLAIIDDVFKKSKCTMPELKSLSFRQDNAGCYHSAATILGVRQLSIKHNFRCSCSEYRFWICAALRSIRDALKFPFQRAIFPCLLFIFLRPIVHQ